MALRLGSLCTGIAGLDLAVSMMGVEHETVFVSDIDKGANLWLDQNVAAENIGDFTQLDALPECDIITAGFPCQPFSTAGDRRGVNDERFLFDDIVRVVRGMASRPTLLLENVPGLLTANDGHALARVVHGLATIGYDLEYGLLAASSVGAPHRRLRWWGVARHPDSVAWPATEHRTDRAGSDGESGTGTDPRSRGSAADADSGTTGRHSRAVPRSQEQGWREPHAPDRSGNGRDGTAADASGSGHIEGWEASDQDRLGRFARRSGGSAADTDGAGSQARSDERSGSERSRPQPVGSASSPADADSERSQGRQVLAERGNEQAAGSRDLGSRFKQYAGAVERWELILGRPAPDPVIDGKLSEHFVEWMMGFPQGWVTDTLDRRTQALHALGNAVVPQAAAIAYSRLIARQR